MSDYLLADPEHWPVVAVKRHGYLVSEWFGGVPLFAAVGERVEEVVVSPVDMPGLADGRMVPGLGEEDPWIPVFGSTTEAMQWLTERLR